MENIDIFFNFCLILAAGVLAIWGAGMIVENISIIRKQHKKEATLPQKQEVLRNLAYQQKIHYTSK